jgi:MFS transporter, FSR family, fosmidomycin resistance protein
VDPATRKARSLAIASLSHFINDGTVFFVPVIAAIVAARPGTSAGVVTLIFLVYYSSSAVLSLVAGRLADRFGHPGSLLGLGLAILSLGLFGFYIALAETSGTLEVAVLLISALLTGSGASFYHPLGGSLLQAAFADRSLGLALGVNGAMGSLGRALYPSLYFVGAAVISGYGSVALFAVVGLVAATAAWLGMRPTAAERERMQEARKTAERPRSADAITRGIVILTGVAFVRSVATRGIVAWIPTYLATQRSLGVSADLGFAVTTMYAAAIIGQPIFGLLVDRLDKRLVLATATLGSAVSIFIYLGTPTGLIAQAWLFVFGFFTFSGFPLLLSMVRDYVPRSANSLANALVWGIGSTTGGALGPFLVGVLSGGDYGRLGFAFTVCAAAAVLSALATALVPRATHVSKMAAFS